jgi:serine/threonine-protein kinase
VPDIATRLRAALGDRYLIEEEIGRGGAATVYLAEDLKHARKVAIKVLRPDTPAGYEPQRFLREIRIAARLAHPQILPLHDSGECDGLLYFVMPYAGCESLRDRLDREGALPLDVALRITRAVAGALAYAHRLNVIHRDIKPENILLQEGEPVVADFGVATAVSAAGGDNVYITDRGFAVGTPAYMSPEQASAESGLDGRTDQYSLACVLYEMLSSGPWSGRWPNRRATDSPPWRTSWPRWSIPAWRSPPRWPARGTTRAPSPCSRSSTRAPSRRTSTSATA